MAVEDFTSHGASGSHLGTPEARAGGVGFPSGHISSPGQANLIDKLKGLHQYSDRMSVVELGETGEIAVGALSVKDSLFLTAPPETHV